MSGEGGQLEGLGVGAIVLPAAGVSGARVPPVGLPGRATRGERVTAGLLAAACLGVLIVGASLNPDPSGMGTHTQLGLRPCGWVVAFGKPCLTCGMTTAVTNVAHGRFLTGFITQPAGALFGVGCAAVFWGALHVVLTGSRLGRLCGKLLGTRTLWLTAMVVAGAWVYKLATWQQAS